MALAEDLVRQDREINRLNREVFQLAIEVGDDVDTREWAMHMVMVARALERIGDNAVDIGEQTAFVVTGLFREFSDSSHPGVTPRRDSRSSAGGASDYRRCFRLDVKTLYRMRAGCVHVLSERHAGDLTALG